MIKELSETTEHKETEHGFLAWLLLLGEQDDLALHGPAGEDALAVADAMRQCVVSGCLVGTEPWTVLDVAAHIGHCDGTGTLPAEWVRDGLEAAHRVFLARSGGDALDAFSSQVEPPAVYLRALSAEPNLLAADRLVNALASLVRPTDELCYSCTWTLIVRPLIRPLVGWERGQPSQAADPQPQDLRPVDLSHYLDNPPQADEPITETERWLRSEEAWQAVEDYLTARLYQADPGNGCRIGRAL